MGKIRLNLASGAVVEKPLVNAFKAQDNSYVVLDNEMNGSMGLPIILVSKLSGNKLVKITDTNEWQQVKEYLKNIIAGNALEYISVAEEVAADDIYYTQLTLPIPSFEALRNAYKIDNVAPTPEVAAEPESKPTVEPAAEENNVTLDQAINSIDTPSDDIAKESAPIENPSPVVEPPKEEPTPELNFGLDLNSPTPETTPEPVSEPKVEASPVAPVVEPQVMMSNMEAEITPTPVIETPTPEVVQPEAPQSQVMDIEPNTNLVTTDAFKEQKEAFMQACENMFDALVQKFEKEINNRK